MIEEPKCIGEADSLFPEGTKLSEYTTVASFQDYLNANFDGINVSYIKSNDKTCFRYQNSLFVCVSEGV